MSVWQVIGLFSLLLLMFEIFLNTAKRNISLQMANESGLTFASFFKFQPCPLFAAGLCVGCVCKEAQLIKTLKAKPLHRESLWHR